MLDQRSKQCVDYCCPYETIPFDREWYQGDNEPDNTTTDTTVTIAESCSVHIVK